MVKDENMGENFVTRSEFAALQGWAPSYVTKLGHQGRLVFSPDNPKLIDVAATLAELEVSGDPRKAYLRLHHLGERVRKHVTPFINSDAPSDDQRGDGGKYWKVRARRESTLADLAALELTRMQSTLVERSRVEAAAKALERWLHDALLNIPAQLAPELATISDSFQTETRLRETLRKVFADCAQMSLDELLEKSSVIDQRSIMKGY